MQDLFLSFIKKMALLEKSNVICRVKKEYIIFLQNVLKFSVTSMHVVQPPFHILCFCCFLRKKSPAVRQTIHIQFDYFRASPYIKYILHN